MPRSPEENQRIRDERRDQFLRAAEQLFATKGYANTRMTEIASAAGVSHGLLYHYFTSKEALFAALIDEMMERIASDFSDGGATPLERLERTLERSVERVTSAPRSHKLIVQAMLQGGVPDALRKRLTEHGAENVRRLVEMIRAAQESGEVTSDVDADQLAGVLICALRGMTIRPPGNLAKPYATPTARTLLLLLRPTERSHDG